MINISWIYVVDNRGVPIFLYESYTQGAKDSNHALISRFLQQLQLLASSLGIKEIKEIKIDNNTYYITQDKKSQYIFIIKPTPNANQEDITRILIKIKNLFIKKYSKHMDGSIDKKRNIFRHLKDDIWKLIELEIDVGTLL